jgi:hypothetical protein
MLPVSRDGRPFSISAIGARHSHLSSDPGQAGNRMVREVPGAFLLG